MQQPIHIVRALCAGQNVRKAVKMACDNNHKNSTQGRVAAAFLCCMYRVAVQSSIGNLTWQLLSLLTSGRQKAANDWFIILYLQSFTSKFRKACADLLPFGLNFTPHTTNFSHMLPTPVNQIMKF